jgi:Mce-associated membrane protein
VSEGKTPSTAAEIRAMAEQAEAEAAEAEALAAAARARARAIQLRKQAELLEAGEAAGPSAEEPTESEQAKEPEVTRPEVARLENATDDVPAGADADAGVKMPAPKKSRRQRPKLSLAAAILAAVVVVASLTVSALIAWNHHRDAEQHQRAAEFAAAARQGVVTLTTLDFNNAKRDVQRIIDDSTGSFKDEFQKMADDFTKVVEQSKVVEKGAVQAVAVNRDSMTKDSAEVLVVSRSEVTNAAGAKEDPRNFRLVVTVTRDGDQLKMSKVEFVP